MRMVLELLYGLSFFVTLVFFIKSLSKRDVKARYIQLILLLSALMILIYCLTLANESSALARCNYVVAAIMSDWIFWCILQYLYVVVTPEKNLSLCEKNFNHAVFVIIILDSVIQLLNFTIPISAQIVTHTHFGKLYHTMRPQILYYIHLAVCGGVVVLAGIVLWKKLRCMPQLYRKKYRIFFLLFLLCVSAQIVNAIIGMCVDPIALMYGLLSVLVYLFSYRLHSEEFLNEIESHVVQSSSIGTIFFDFRQRLLSYNERGASVFQLTQDMLERDTLNTFVSRCFPAETICFKAPAEFAYSCMESGEQRFFRVSYTPMWENETILGSYFMLQDVTVQSKLLADKEYWATHDSLTGLPTRATFYKKVQDLVTSFPDTTFLMVQFEIDAFSLINELFGRKAGDMLLRAIAGILREQIDSGAYTHIDADHFAFCIPESQFDLISELSHLVNASPERIGLRQQIRSNFGIYKMEDQVIPIEQMCDWAGSAAQTVKGNYWDFYSFYDTRMHDVLLQEQEFLREMDEALEQNQFEVFLQPQYNYATKKITGSEALVRWNHPEKGYIQPNQFIPAFERNGFIVQLDKYVWERSCQYLSDWARDGSSLKDISISINISRLDFVRIDLCEVLTGLIQKYGLPSSALRLEITESAYINNPEQIIKEIEKLQELGFIVEMDDFGSGYSSLNVLKDVPVNVLKLDIRFLSGADHNIKGGNILQSVVRMANWINLPVIAEGVETQEQADYLKGIGCEIIQGYFYSRPVPVRDFEKMVIDSVNAETAVSKKNYQNPLLDELLALKSEGSKLFNESDCGLAVLELCGEQVELIRNNDAFCRLHGMGSSIGALDRTNWLARIHDLDREEYLSMLKNAITPKKEEACESRWRTAGGEYAHILSWAKLLAVSENRYAFLVIACNVPPFLQDDPGGHKRCFG